MYCVCVSVCVSGPLGRAASGVLTEQCVYLAVLTDREHHDWLDGT